MRQTRSTNRQGAMHTKGKRLILLSLLLVALVILSGCYMDPDPVVDGEIGQGLGPVDSFNPVITPTPEATPTPTVAPVGTDSTWDNFWGTGTATPDPAAPTGQVGGPITTPQGGQATAAPTISGTTPTYETLRSGSKGEAVTRLQNRLKELGYYPGTVDGDYGQGTVTAVRTFQSANNLSADGVAGQKTQEVLYSYYAIKASDANVTVTQGTSRPTNTPRPNVTSTPRPTNTPPAGRTDIYLRLGDSGSEVTKVQNRLIALGYLSGSADGQFQDSTQAAVIAFQKNNSLDSDGVAGPTTLSKLYSNSARKANRVESNLGSLRRGTNGGGVRALQRLLKDKGYYSGSIDGDYGAGTEAAVIAFQQANGLTADGIAGAGTMNALHSGGASASSGGGSSGGGGGSSGGGTSPQTYGLRASTNGYSTLSASSGSSANITALQSVLQSRNFYSGTLDGSYGGGTTAAVSDYQRSAGLRVTGLAGPTTQRLLFGGTSESGSYSKLEEGSTGDRVRNLQYTLYELMYYDGNITGTFDSATRNAVLLFQQVNGLSVDGVAGEATQRRLYSSNAIPCNI